MFVGSKQNANINQRFNKNEIQQPTFKTFYYAITRIIV